MIEKIYLKNGIMKKNTIKPEEVTNGSHQKVHWICLKGHKWEACIKDRISKGCGCPYCSNRKVLEGFNDITTTNPEILKEWDYEKNVILPTEVTISSDKKVWWKCEKGHSWETRIAAKSKGYGCPYCSNRKVLEGFNDLESQFPDIIKEWNYDRNTITPSKIVYGSNQKAWWKCKEGHEWEARISDRIGGYGCPYCSNQKVLEGFNDISTTHPEILKEWNYEKNTIKPEEVSYGSSQKVWWKCEEGHEWEATIANRIKESGCPRCNIEKVNSFCEQAVYYYVKQLFPEAINGDQHLGVELDIYIPSHGIAIEYDGEAWHNNKKRLENDKRKNQICVDNKIELVRIREPKCPPIDNCAVIVRRDCTTMTSLDDVIKQTLKHISTPIEVEVDVVKDTPRILEQYATKKYENSLANCNPEIAKEWHPIKNGTLTPDKVSRASNHKVWWLGKCGHEWQSVVGNRTLHNGGGCPYCTHNVILKGENDFETWCKKNNREDLLQEWHIEKNKNLTPSDIFPHSSKKCWWLGKCGHEWEMTVGNRTKQNQGCPICYKNKKSPPVQCVETGEVYKNAQDAAKAKNLKSTGTIYNVCNGKKHYNTAGGYHWKYVNNE